MGCCGSLRVRWGRWGRIGLGWHRAGSFSCGASGSGAAGLHHALTGMGQLTAGAAANYEQTEQGIAASFGRA
jgi:hypothetical protein